MAWIETHQSVLRHRKTLMVAQSLGLQPVHVVGHLAALWLWAIDNAPDGHIRAAPRIIAKAADFEGSARAFVRALEHSGYLDLNGDGWLLHNWDDYAGKLIRRREQNKARMRAAREPHVQRTEDARGEHVQTRVKLPNPTVPNTTEPKAKTFAPAARERDPIWDALVAAYGEPPKNPNLRGSWNTAAKELREQGVTPEDIATRVRYGRASKSDWAVVTPMALAKHFNLPLSGTSQPGRRSLEMARKLEADRDAS